MSCLSDYCADGADDADECDIVEDGDATGYDAVFLCFCDVCVSLAPPEQCRVLPEFAARRAPLLFCVHPLRAPSDEYCEGHQACGPLN